MRKTIVVVLALVLLMAGTSFAEGPPRDGTSSLGKTSFTNIAVTGISETGVPGYIELTSTGGTVFYLFIDEAGDLRTASAAAMTEGDGDVPAKDSSWVGSGTQVGAR